MSLICSFSVDNLKVGVFDTRTEMGTCAGNEAAEIIKKVIAEKGTANILFAAAPSQNETLKTLCQSDIDWSKVNAFHMDEYIGLDENHPAGFRNFLKRAIFDKFSFSSVNLLNGNAPDPYAEAERYSALLEKYPLDICMCGIGENGHIAFNDPAVADFQDKAKVKVVSLDDICRHQQVNDGCFTKDNDVPTQALTVTIPGMTSAIHMFCSVPAQTKANAVKHMLQDEISEKCPATILRKHGDARLYLDADSAKLVL